MKILVFSDIHIHNFKQHSEGTERLEHTLRCLKLIFAYADKQGITTILFGGDMFEMQKALPTIVINRTLETFRELFDNYPAVQLSSISGNHDHDAMNLISKEANSSQKFLAESFPTNYILLDNANTLINVRSTYEDKVRGVVNIIGIPYYEYGEDFKVKLEEASKKIVPNVPNILMQHQTPKGVKNSKYYKVDIDENASVYDKFDLTVNGHIHLEQRLAKNFLNIGAPMHQDFGDAGTNKGFWIIDTKDLQGEHKFVNLNSKFPTFVKREADADPSEEEKESDYVQILPKIVGDNGESAEGIENFRADLAEEELIRNYLEEISKDDPSLAKYEVEKNDELLNVGIGLIGE